MNNFKYCGCTHNYLFILVFCVVIQLGYSQDSSVSISKNGTLLAQTAQNNRFRDEVAITVRANDSIWDKSKETIVFVGSSSIKMWEELQDMFPGHQVLNSGFGGSQASDLLIFLDSIVLRYNPKKVFIYEGDNDVAAGKGTDEIIGNMKEIIKKVKRHNVATEIVLISTKPSIARWDLKGEYKRLNRHLRRLGKRADSVFYADVWKPMISKGKLKKSIFLKDGLHMNATGYRLWYDVLKDYIK
ncbi:GDSL-type esterase/lipase family protein [Arenibacter sp. S6351L]|uniref:GDSL-type esterase/lipase family protein n=1 Tax=Arenibacter sp. S6351L TaxID=2926407 RepID=UPI001FF6BD10|nr:GDSL-type esterase/lipase family protein [Arenibacter sp. S6351L]MCK0136075.1 GDSL-type esterase/lipase family protein [Arenibacter sp. S6351L]